MALVISGILSPAELLKGLSNQQIIIIFLLVLVTAGIRSLVGTELLRGFFKENLSPKAFLLRLMIFSSSTSSLLNNTPIVAFLIPYVKDWASRTGNSSSKFLIPLSHATILGGMITVVGTSTNLVLNGLIESYQLPLLNFTDFLYLGLIVTVIGWVYFYFVGYALLPENKDKLTTIYKQLKEYIVETELSENSKLIGRTVKEAGLRNLQDVFLVEILRDEQVISPVSPEQILHSGDLLFFSGNTSAIYKLIEDDNGLRLPKQEHIEKEGQFNFVEAIVPSGSDLTGVKIKDSNFRSRFNASIIAVHRDGKRLVGKMGETQLAGGDFLLLLAGESSIKNDQHKDLFYLSAPQKLSPKKPFWYKWLGFSVFAALILGVLGFFPLFSVCLALLCVLIFSGRLSLSQIRQNLDLSLLLILVCSLSIGIALEKTGTADMLATMLLKYGQEFGPVVMLSVLFMTTILLTSLITNAAAVSIMFPIAMAIATQMDLNTTPFFVAIAFAASGDFMTPIGYQTNLMVYGPGGYTFKDFLKTGTPFTVLYSIVCLTFIVLFYKL